MSGVGREKTGYSVVLKGYPIQPSKMKVVTGLKKYPSWGSPATIPMCAFWAGKGVFQLPRPARLGVNPVLLE